MDPYLESIWTDVHVQLVPTLANLLTPLLVPKYITDLDSRIGVERPLDEATQPTASTFRGPLALRLKTPIELPTRLVTLRIREADTMKLVTIIELLSPVNKRGEGRREYLQKRNEVLDSKAHLVEIDLVRQGRRMPFLGELPATPYLAMVSRAYARPNCEVWPIRLQDPLPVLPVPLLRPDPDVPLDLGEALRATYTAARYDLRIRYDQPPPPPPLSDEETVWLEAQLQQSSSR
jgi:hypothetical protein